MKIFIIWFVLITNLAGQNPQDSTQLSAEIDSLIKLNRTLVGQNKFDEALIIIETAKNKAEIRFGKYHKVFTSCLFNQGRTFLKINRLLEAEQLLLEVKRIQEIVIGRETIEVAITEFNLGMLYSRLNKYLLAIHYYLDANAIQEKINGVGHPDNISCMINLGAVYFKSGNYEKAEYILIKAKHFLNLTLNEGSQNQYWACQNNLGSLYYELGKYDNAELVYLDNISRSEKIFGIENQEYALSLNNLASLYGILGNNEKTEKLFIKAKSIREKTLGNESLDYAVSLINLAIFYQSINKCEQAEELFCEAKNIFEKKHTKKHPEYARCLNNLASLYSNLGDLKNAESLYLEAIEIQENILGNDHPDYASTLHNLGWLYTKIENYEKAEFFQLKAKSIREKILGKEHKNYATSLENLSMLYDQIGNYKRAEIYQFEFEMLNRLLLIKATRFMSIQELNQYILTFTSSLENIYSSAQLNYRNRYSISKICYDNCIFYKGFLLNSNLHLRRLIFLDSIAAIKFNTLKLYERKIYTEYSKSIIDRNKDILCEILIKANELEKDLINTVPEYGQSIQQIKWQEIQEKITTKTASIEFIYFRLNSKTAIDSLMYAALVLLPNDTTPHFVPLFEEKELNQLLSTSQSRRMDYVSDLYHAPNERGTIPNESQYKSLYELIWKPIEPYLKGVNKIYFSPSGLLHRINQNAIAINDQTLLSDRYDLVQLGSTRQLVTNNDDKKSKILNACIYGGINFEMDSTAMMAKHHEIDTNGIALRSELSFSYTDSTLRGGLWNYLNGSEEEANEINKIINKTGIKSTLYKGNNATEEAFKKLGDYKAESPQIIHISTHGYFFPDAKISRQSSVVNLQDEPVFKISEHPMLRSGLIMAGANHAWKTGKPITPEAEDGILTAYEISQLNLRNTELVVLSACETGLGDIQGNEGVYGLQRAFKIAGAKNLIMSLWQVPDQQTSELMTAFYKYWLIKKKSIRESLKLAQNDLRKKGLESFYWAGFVLVE